MKNTSPAKPKARLADDLRSEYCFDYTKAQPNRFAKQVRPGSVAVVLDPDVAGAFKNAESVNAALRALLTTMPTRRARASR